MLALVEDFLQNFADLQHVVNSMLHVDIIFENIYEKLYEKHLYLNITGNSMSNV